MTLVRCTLPKAAEVKLGLYDASGRIVAKLASGRHEPGRYAVPLVSVVLTR